MLRLQESKKLAVLRNFPQVLRNDIRHFYNDLRLRYDNLCDKFDILQELPNNLKSELSLFINSEIIQKVNFFQFADPSFILIISKFLKPKLCLQDNYIIYKGEVATKMYFVKSGIVQVLSTDNQTVIAYMSEGTYFGEIGVLLTQKRTCFVKARTTCVFFTIGASDLIQALKSFPIQDKFLRAVAKQRLRTTNPDELIEKDKEFEIAAQQQIKLQSIDSKSQLGNLFEIQKKEKNVAKREQTLIILHSIKNEKKIQPKFYLTEEFKFIPNFIIIPFSRMFNFWSLLFVTAFCYNVLYIPFSIGLDFEIENSYYVIDLLAIVIMIIDSFLRPFLAIDSSTEIEIQRSKIQALYVQHYLLLDLLSSIPFDYVLIMIDGTKYVRQCFRLLRLFKYYRIKELIKLIRKRTIIDEPLFRICLLFIFFIITSHWFNCILIFIAIREQKSKSRFDGKNLLDFMVSLPYSVQPPADQMSKWQLYFNLLILQTCYMGSIMYGDIIPFTIGEEVMGIFQMIIGRIFISFLFAEISSYVSSKYSTYNNHIQTKNRITKWMQLNNIDYAIRKRVIKYFDFKWNNQKGIEEYTIIKDLPTHLRVNVKNYVFHNLIQNSELFPKEDLGFISTITAKLQRRLAPKNEFVIKQGELATEMFFILKGEVIVVTEDGVQVATLKKYMHFGEMALIERKVQLRSTSIRASTDVVLAVLTQKDFDLICYHYPEFQTRMREIGEYRTKDSLAKGVKISYERKSTISENKQLIRFLSQKKGIPIINDAELSMIEEESKREYEPNNHDQGKQNDYEESSISEDTSQNKREQVSKNLNLDIQDLEDGNYPDLVIKSNSTRFLSSQLKLDPQLQTLKVPDQSPSTPYGCIQQTFNTEQRIETRRNTVEIEQDGFIKIWEAPKLLSSVGDLNQYFKNVKGTSKKIYRKIIALFIAQTMRHSLLFIIVLYNIIFIPLQMGFSIQFLDWFLFMEIITLTVYTVDMIIIAKVYRQLWKQKNQSAVFPIDSTSKFIHDQDELERRLKFLKLNFISTLIGIIPFSWVLQKTTSPLFLINFLRVLRLVKIWPFYRVIQLLKKINVNFVRWVEVLITYYVVSHVVAGVMLCEGLTAEDIRQTWLNRVPSPLSDGVRKENNLNGVSSTSLYIHALYFVTNTISHVAIGDLTTVSTDERALNAFLVWNLTFFYAFCFANIASIVGDFLGNNFLTFHEKFSNVMAMIPHEKIPKKIIQNINNYYDYIWVHSQGFNETQEIYAELPTQIKYDVMICRYQESIQNSLIFKNDKGQIDVPMVNSIFELMKIRVYMSNDFIIKCGSYGQSLYVFLDGEALMFGINNELLCIMSSGTHFNNDMGEVVEQDFDGKRLCHVVAKTLTIVGVIEQDALKTLFEAYPFWKLIITKLNRSLQNSCRQALQKYMLQIGAELTYERELKAIENVCYLFLIIQHLTFSDDSVYEGILYKLEDPKNRFIYHPESEQYQKFDFLHNQLKVFQLETGVVQMKKLIDISYESVIITKTTGMMGSNQYNFSLEQYQSQGQSKIKRCCRKIYCSQASKRRKFVDFLHLINMIYMAIAIPLQIAFIDSMDTSFILEIMSIIIQILVIFVNFRTPIIVRGGYTINFNLVLKNYLSNGLIFDLFGILPLNCILGFLNIHYPTIILISILRLLRILGIQKLLQIFEKFEIYLKSMNIFMYILKTILILYLLWHWTACFWFYINKRIEPDLYEMTWYKTFNLNQKNTIEQYLLSLYYVIKIVTGVGQSDMITYNDLERVCFMIMINIGDSLFAFAFGLIASIQIHISENNEFQKFLQKMKQIDEFLESINFDKSQSVRVEQYYSYSFYMKNKTNLIETKDLKNYLPYCLLRDVIYYSQREILIPMFKTFKSDNLIREVASTLTNLIYMPGDYIIFKDQIGEEMYFIVEGQVQIIAADKQTVLKTLSKGNYFGEIAIFMHTKRISYVQAKTFCVVSMLRKTDLDDIIINFPEVAKQFSFEAQKRIDETKELERKRMIQSENNTEGLDEDDDLDLSFIEEINNRLENSYQSVRSSEHSNHSLIKQMKRKSINIDDNEIKSIRKPDSKGVTLPKISITQMSSKNLLQSLNIQEDNNSIREIDNESNSDENSFILDKSKKNQIEEVKINFIKKSPAQQELTSNAFSLSSSDDSQKDKSDEGNDSFKEIRKVRMRKNSIMISPIIALKKHMSYQKGEEKLIADRIFNETDLEDMGAESKQKRSSSHQLSKQRRNTEILPNKLSYEFGKTKQQVREKQIKQSIKKEPMPIEIFKAQIKKEEQEQKNEKSSIRRQGKTKNNKRRLSKISLGKNLMLSQTAGLKLQWTVGK